VETILNYGRMEDVLRLIELMGIENVARVFARTVGLSSRRANNYHHLTRNYFHRVFERYAPRCLDR
jgi:hypothetical protein